MTASPQRDPAATRVLRVSLALGGTAILALGVLAVVISIEGRFGPTPLLGVLGHIWEIIFAVALIPTFVAMFLVSRGARSVSSSAIAILAALSLGAAALVGILRLAGLVELFLPLANWLPGTLLLAAWGWVAARAAVREGHLGQGTRRLAGAVLIAQIALVVFSSAAVLVGGTTSMAASISAGAAAGALWIVLGASWLAFAAQWHGQTHVVAS
jgi:hypothetical protein